MSLRTACTLALSLAMAFAGCLERDERDEEPSETPQQAPNEDDNVTFAITSPAFADGEPIPREYTCDAGMEEDLSPPLNVTGIPPAAVSLAMIVEDRDVPFPEAPLRTITHWTIWNLTPDNGTVTFAEGENPGGAREGAEGGWNGPCPPVGSSPHRYHFTAYALDQAPDVADGAPRTELEAAMEGHVLATTRLMGTYARQPV